MHKNACEVHKHVFKCLEMHNTTKFPNFYAEYIIYYHVQSSKRMKTSRKRPAAVVLNGRKQDNTGAKEM